MRIDLWKDYETWKTACKFVDLSHELSPATPHWSGFDDMVVEMPFDYPRDGFRAHRFTLVSQRYRTRVKNGSSRPIRCGRQCLALGARG